MNFGFVIILSFLIILSGHSQTTFISKTDTSNVGVPVFNPEKFYRIKSNEHSFKGKVYQLHQDIKREEIQENSLNFWTGVNYYVLFMTPIYNYSPVFVPFKGMSSGDYSQIYDRTHIRESNIQLKRAIGVH